MKIPILNCLCLLWPLAASAIDATFSSASSIIINDSASPPTVATPYPAVITVTGLAGQVVTKVTVQLNNLSHTFPDDIDILLVGPEGQKAMLMSNVGGSTRTPVTDVTLTLDDDAPSSLPLESALVSGTFKPTKRLATLQFDFPAHAPPGNSNAVSALSVFNNTEPNGTWSLFVVDDASPDSGVISGGWSLALTTTPVLLSILRVGTNVVLSWTNAAAAYTLQTTPSLSPPAVWTDATPPAVDVSGRLTVTNLISSGRRFYRLVR
jgi:subtilisin-like proprotein convertase family protein